MEWKVPNNLEVKQKLSSFSATNFDFDFIIGPTKVLLVDS